MKEIQSYRKINAAVKMPQTPLSTLSPVLVVNHIFPSPTKTMNFPLLLFGLKAMAAAPTARQKGACAVSDEQIWTEARGGIRR